MVRAVCGTIWFARRQGFPLGEGAVGLGQALFMALSTDRDCVDYDWAGTDCDLKQIFVLTYNTE